MIGPSPVWEPQMQWLAWNGYAPEFVFKPLPLPAVT